MSALSPLLQELINALRCLPGVGNKSAQRMAFHLLEKSRPKAIQLAEVLQQAMQSISRCKQCRNFTEAEICNICSNDKRESNQLCVVESPADILAIEHSHCYHGRYFVLLGHLSPIDGIGPAELGLDRLAERLQQESIAELILATSATVEGEATAQYILELARNRNIPVSRIAHGVPIGGELEYIDGSTLAHAFSGRRNALN